MRRLLLVIVFASCSHRTSLPNRTYDAAADAAADAGRDSAVRDAVPGTDAPILAADLGASRDVPPAVDGDGGCTALPVTALPEPPPERCPPSAEAAACAGGDVGAVVARNADCIKAWGNIPLQCVLWPGPTAGEELVAIQLDNCTDVIDTVAAFACKDHIELSYVGRGTCQSCDGTRSAWRAFSVPLDSRPVVATGHVVEPPCLPPTAMAAR
jgi:hypothetical protein